MVNGPLFFLRSGDLSIMSRFIVYSLLMFALYTSITFSSPVGRSGQTLQGRYLKYDVVIYDATPAAITAALQTKRMGKTVAIVATGAHIGV